MGMKVEENGTSVESIKEHKPNGHIVTASPAKSRAPSKPRKSIPSILAR